MVIELIEFSLIQLSKRTAITNLKSYLLDTWGKRLPLRKVETLNINGMESITGIAKVTNPPSYIRMIAAKRNSKNIFRFIFVSPH